MGGNSGRRIGLTGIGLAVIMLLTLSGCAELFRNHGYAPSDTDLGTVVVGEATREDVAAAIGRPSSSGVLSTAAWYYVESRWRHYAFKAPEEVAREVVAVSFSEAGLVENIERFTLKDGVVVPLSRRVTESNIKGISVIKQLLGNFGRITADQVTN